MNWFFEFFFSYKTFSFISAKPPQVHLSRSTDSCIDFDLQAGGYPQNLTSPNYPDNYTLNTYCQWLINSTSISEKIALTLVDFDTEAGYDPLMVYDGSTQYFPPIQSFSGHVTQQTVVSSGPYMYITFSSDSIIVDKGFLLQYEAYNTPEPEFGQGIESNASSLSSPLAQSENTPFNLKGGDEIICLRWIETYWNHILS